MTKINLPQLKSVSKIGLLGFHVSEPGGWIAREDRHYFRGSVTDILCYLSQNISPVAIKKAIEKHYKKHILASNDSETVLTLDGKRQIIIELYTDSTDDESSEPKLVMHFKDGKRYPGDVRRILIASN